MQPATTTGRNLEIDGMTGAECVEKVTGVLKGVRGVTTRSVSVGAAAIDADVAGTSEACNLLQGAGFRTREIVARTPAGPARADDRRGPRGGSSGATFAKPVADPAPPAAPTN